MTLQQFIDRWNGQYCEIAGSTAPNQCVDLANQYIQDVLGFPIIEWTNAVDFPTRAGDRYEWIENGPVNIPQEGDIVVWDGQYGHIAIFVEGDVNRFKSFDQNYPIGTPCHLQEHNYSGVNGWLRPKLVVKPDQMYNEFQDKLGKYFNQVVSADFVVTFLNERKREIESKDQRIGELEKVVSSQSTQLLENRLELDRAVQRAELEMENAKKAEALRSKWYSLYQTKSSQLETAEKGLATCSQKLTKCEKGKTQTLGEHIVAAWTIIWSKINGVKA